LLVATLIVIIGLVVGAVVAFRGQGARRKVFGSVLLVIVLVALSFGAVVAMAM